MTQVESRHLVFLLFPFLLVILLQEVAIGNFPHFQPRLPIVGQFLLVAEQRAAAERVGECNIAAVQAQVIVAVVVDVPGIDEAVVAPGPIEESLAVVIELCAAAKAAVAQVIEAHDPIGPLRFFADAQNLVRIQIQQELIAEYLVVPVSEAIDV